MGGKIHTTINTTGNNNNKTNNNNQIQQDIQPDNKAAIRISENGEAMTEMD